MYNRDTLLTDLRANVIEVHFTKVDGSMRVMKCTLNPKHLPAAYVQEQNEEKDFHQKNPDTIAVWDVEVGGWRSFRVDSVQYCQSVDY